MLRHRYRDLRIIDVFFIFLSLFNPISGVYENGSINTEVCLTRYQSQIRKKYLVSDQCKKAELPSSENETKLKCSIILTTSLA
jgi:hypothetical protein